MSGKTTILDFEYSDSLLGGNVSIEGIYVQLFSDGTWDSDHYTDSEGRIILYLTEEVDYTFKYRWFNILSVELDINESISETIEIELEGYTIHPMFKWDMPSTPLFTDIVDLLWFDGSSFVVVDTVSVDGSGVVIGGILNLMLGVYMFEGQNDTFTIAHNDVQDVPVFTVYISPIGIIISIIVMLNPDGIIIKRICCHPDRSGRILILCYIV